MSGTSLDGVDVAVIETDGVDIFGFGDTDSLDFDRIIDAGSNETVKSVLRKTISAALEWQFQGQSPNIFALAEDICDDCHIQAISNLIGFDLEYPWITNLEVIGYHGLTVLHHPPKNEVGGKTLQIGSGQRLSDVFDLPVVYDFRTADVEAGGQGAPLAPIYHEALVRFSKLEGRIAVLNIGGVSNVTAIEDGQIVWSTDCGPGNGPLDSWVWALTDNDYDVDGRSSLKGRVDFRLVNQWLKSDFFTRSIPRSADRYDFDVLSDIKDKSLEDGAASLASFCAQAVARDLQAFKAEIVIVCGGGRKNPAIMGMLKGFAD